MNIKEELNVLNQNLSLLQDEIYNSTVSRDKIVSDIKEKTSELLKIDSEIHVKKLVTSENSREEKLSNLFKDSFEEVIKDGLSKIDEHSSKYSEKIKELSNERNAIISEIKNKSNELLKKESETASLDIEISTQKETLSDILDTISLKSRSLTKVNNEILSKEEVVFQKEVTIKSLNEKIKTLEEELENKNSVFIFNLEEREKTIATRERNVEIMRVRVEKNFKRMYPDQELYI